MKILTDQQGNQFVVKDESTLTPHNGEVLKKVTVLKSARTEAGAKDFMKLYAHKYPDAKIIKSFDGYSDVAYGDVGPMPQMPVHVVVEESMSPVVQTVSVKDADDMFRAMFKKGLISVGSGGVYPTDKFYNLLGQFVEQSFNDIMKSVDPDVEKTDAGENLADVLAEALKVLKAVAPSVGGGAKAMTEDSVGPEGRPSTGAKGEVSPETGVSQEEADNKKGDTRTKDVPEDGTGSEHRPSTGSTGDTVPNMALSQEAADNKNEGIVAISDAEAKSKFGNVQVMKATDSDTYFFKSYGDFVAANRKAKNLEGRAPTYEEKQQYGSRWAYAATERVEVEAAGRWGNKKPKR